MRFYRFSSASALVTLLGSQQPVCVPRPRLRIAGPHPNPHERPAFTNNGFEGMRFLAHPIFEGSCLGPDEARIIWRGTASWIGGELDGKPPTTSKPGSFTFITPTPAPVVKFRRDRFQCDAVVLYLDRYFKSDKRFRNTKSPFPRGRCAGALLGGLPRRSTMIRCGISTAKPASYFSLYGRLSPVPPRTRSLREAGRDWQRSQRCRPQALGHSALTKSCRVRKWIWFYGTHTGTPRRQQTDNVC